MKDSERQPFSKLHDFLQQGGGRGTHGLTPVWQERLPVF